MAPFVLLVLFSLVMQFARAAFDTTGEVSAIVRFAWEREFS